MSHKIKKYSWIHELNRAALDAKCMSEIFMLNEAHPIYGTAKRGRQRPEFFGSMTPSTFNFPNDPTVSAGSVVGSPLGAGDEFGRPTPIPRQPNPNAASRITDPNRISALASQMKPPPPTTRSNINYSSDKPKQRTRATTEEGREAVFGIGERGVDAALGKATSDRDVVLAHLASLQGSGSIDTSGWGDVKMRTRSADKMVRPGDEERSSSQIYNMIHAAKVLAGQGSVSREQAQLQKVDWSIFDIPAITQGDVLDAKLAKIANRDEVKATANRNAAISGAVREFAPVDVNGDGKITADDPAADALDGHMDGKSIADLQKRFGGYGPMAGGLASRRGNAAPQPKITQPTAPVTGGGRELNTWDLSDLGPAPDPDNLPIPPDVARRNERRRRTQEFAKGVIGDIRAFRSMDPKAWARLSDEAKNEFKNLVRPYSRPRPKPVPGKTLVRGPEALAHLPGPSMADVTPKTLRKIEGQYIENAFKRMRGR